LTKTSVISKHLNNIFKTGELDENYSVYSILEYIAPDGKSKMEIDTESLIGKM